MDITSDMIVRAEIRGGRYNITTKHVNDVLVTTSFPLVNGYDDDTMAMPVEMTLFDNAKTVEFQSAVGTVFRFAAGCTIFQRDEKVRTMFYTQRNMHCALSVITGTSLLVLLDSDVLLPDHLSSKYLLTPPSPPAPIEVDQHKYMHVTTYCQECGESMTLYAGETQPLTSRTFEHISQAVNCCSTGGNSLYTNFCVDFSSKPITIIVHVSLTSTKNP